MKSETTVIENADEEKEVEQFHLEDEVFRLMIGDAIKEIESSDKLDYRKTHIIEQLNSILLEKNETE